MMDPVSLLLKAVEILKLPGTTDVIFAEWVSSATIQSKVLKVGLGLGLGSAESHGTRPSRSSPHN